MWGVKKGLFESNKKILHCIIDRLQTRSLIKDLDKNSTKSLRRKQDEKIDNCKKNISCEVTASSLVLLLMF